MPQGSHDHQKVRSWPSVYPIYFWKPSSLSRVLTPLVFCIRIHKVHHHRFLEDQGAFIDSYEMKNSRYLVPDSFGKRKWVPMQFHEIQVPSNQCGSIIHASRTGTVVSLLLHSRSTSNMKILNLIFNTVNESPGAQAKSGSM